MFRFNPGKANKVFPPKHPYYKAPNEAKKQVKHIVENISVSPTNNKSAFRQLQAQARNEVKAKEPFSENSKRYYSGHIYYGNHEKNSIIAHCFSSSEIDATLHLQEIFPILNNGKYIPLDTRRPNYKKKQKIGVLHFTSYQFEYNGRMFQLKCQAIMDSKEHYFVKEHPYSLKEKE